MAKKLKIEESVETHLQGNLLNECMDFIVFLKDEKCSFPKFPNVANIAFWVDYNGSHIGRFRIDGTKAGTQNDWHKNIPHVSFEMGFSPHLLDYIDGKCFIKPKLSAT